MPRARKSPSQRIHDRFLETYIDQPGARLKFVDHQTFPDTDVKGGRVVEATIVDKGKEVTISGSGTGRSTASSMRCRGISALRFRCSTIPSIRCSAAPMPRP